MGWPPPGEMALGSVTVATTVDGGHSPEYYAERLTDKLIHVAETAPPEIKLQALAYQDAMRQILLDGIKRAIVSNHTTVIHHLRKAGMNEAAELVFALRR